MRWCVALALVLVALVVMTVKTWRRAPRGPAAAPPALADTDPPATMPPPAPAPPAARHDSSGIAHVRGRVFFPAGEEATNDLEVLAENGARALTAQILEGGRFQIHLPPGRYTFVATAGELVGSTPDVLARSGADRDVDIRLAVGAAIRGRLHGLADVFVSASPAGGGEDTGIPEVEDGRFSVGGLIPGRRYDVTFQGPSVRTLTLAGVTAPADGLDVELLARAKITGAIGFERGTRCPISSVHLRIAGKPESEDGEDGTAAEVGKDCAFDLSVPDQVAEVTVVATGKGWFLEEQVAIPPLGDPAPICLNPPCRNDPDEGFARLRLTLDGAPEGSHITADVNAAGNDSSSSGTYHSCHGRAGACDVEGLSPGDTFSISASGRECRSDPVTVTVVAGDNHVRIPCERQRRIEGVIRIPDGQKPDRVVVRCEGGDSHPMIKTRLFRLTCGANVTALEYQIGSEGSWRSIPIASLADLAFVDIGY
jgi:hypothetical protein